MDSNFLKPNLFHMTVHSGTSERWLYARCSGG